MTPILKTSKKSIRELVASFEEIEMLEEASQMDADEADVSLVNQDIEEVSTDINTIDAGIDDAMNIVEEDSELADYAAARAEDDDEVSMESFVLMLNDYNNRSRRLPGAYSIGTVSMEAAEDFNEADKEGKKEKLMGLAKAAAGRAKDIVKAIINAIKDLLKKSGDFIKELLDKSVRLTKKAEELRASISDDKVTDAEVPVSRAAKMLLVNGQFEPKAFEIIEDVNSFSKDYVEKLVHAIQSHDYKVGQPPFAFYQTVREQAKTNAKWIKVGEKEILIGEMPGGLAITRKVEKIGKADNEIETETYSIEKTESHGAKEAESLKLIKKSQRYDLISVAENITKSVSGAKAQYNSVNAALKEIEKFLEETYTKLNSEKESDAESYDAQADIKSIKLLMNNMRTFATNFQKYSLTQVEAILSVVREHDKVAAGGKEEKKEEVNK